MEGWKGFRRVLEEIILIENKIFFELSPNDIFYGIIIRNNMYIRNLCIIVYILYIRIGIHL